jgi:hypothetical protein
LAQEGILALLKQSKGSETLLIAVNEDIAASLIDS